MKDQDYLIFNGCIESIKTELKISKNINDIERYYNQIYGMILLASEMKILKGAQAPEELEKLQNLYFEIIEK